MNSLSLELDTDSGSEVDEMTVETTDFEDELFVFGVPLWSFIMKE